MIVIALLIYITLTSSSSITLDSNTQNASNEVIDYYVNQKYYPKSESNEVVDYYVDETGEVTNFCGESQQKACKELDFVLTKAKISDDVLVHVAEGTYRLPLPTFLIYNETTHPNVDVVAEEEEAQINITGQQQAIGQLIIIL
ncbi:MAG: hypothetical protein EZS28_028354 [Streblomastix strix]|uniref:Pectate lyase superfamily protein domain-containing protein n=1 Tax=Streblomastix strix TaxID=222440 RepID=A0A5J4V063_9EUKA|nr:MAG: hypothetical protein EZS28_028354 [Streblomastix strix]